MHTNYDLSCIGAGLANSSLVLALLHANSTVKIGMFEAKESLQSKRTWCFWGEHNIPNYLKPLIVKSWPKWQVSDEFNTYMQNSKSSKSNYYCIFGEDYYQYFMETCKKTHQVDLHFSQPIKDIVKTKDKYTLKTLDSECISNSKYVSDSRISPCKNTNHNNGLFQCFAGAWLKSTSPIFDDQCVGLMENIFLTKDNALQFLYILPFSKTSALLELTYFSPKTINLSDIKNETKELVESFKIQDDITITDWEQGKLPMSLKRMNRPNNFDQYYTLCGIAAGHIRPSTGYAFLSTQRWASKASQNILKMKPFPSQVTIPKSYLMLDSLFLKVLNKNMAIAPHLFTSLLKNTSASSFSNFMTESCSFLDYLNIINAIPKKEFIGALW